MLNTGFMSFDLIIWDCDGCLVDSEAVACSVAAAYISSLGYPLSTREYVERFAGRSLNSALTEIAREMDDPIDRRFDYEAYRGELWNVFRLRLRAVDGVADILPEMPGARCIASGSSTARVRFSLEIAGLTSLLDAPVFSTAMEDYPSGALRPASKPAPDVFLLAAETMKIDPPRALVIEDSPAGIMGGRAAGMKVFGFMGGSHVTHEWRQRVAEAKPDATFDDMRVLPDLVKNWG